MPDREKACQCFRAIGRTGCDVWQDAEKVRQLRSRFAQRLDVRHKVRLAFSLAAALLDGLFEHPAGVLSLCHRHAGSRSSTVPKWFFPAC